LELLKLAGGDLLSKKYETLIEALERRAAETPDKIAFTFYNNPPCTYNRLWQEVNRFAAFLLQQGLKPKERVLLAIPNSDLFFYAFYGVQRAGGIAVPVYPGSGSERFFKVIVLCDIRFFCISRSFPAHKIDELKQKAKQNNRPIFFVEEISSNRASVSFPALSGEDISFIQFTSGSTGNPKGVQLSHANLLTNIEQMIAGLKITAKDKFVSWLPVYHDMGLILMTMVPFYSGIDLALLPSGLNYIKTWLKTIRERNATFTAAPDFAYRMCLIYIRDPENYDLSCLRVALDAAEPVRYNTIINFEKKFNLDNVMLPAYGLSEATVGVCGWHPREKVKVDERGFVSVGIPFPGVKMRIVTEGRAAEPGETGEIWVHSEANTRGYLKNPGETTTLFAPGGYIRTGDLGYVDRDGDYYIVGRKKNIIIQGGYNISAREIEEMADEFFFCAPNRRCRHR
jgi:acyl-CoA synthetase (AMP-forming)/AMP-acid ligase II